MLNNGSRQHTLDVRNVTFTCALDQESACSRLYSPPDVVHLLNDVSLEAVSGEVHAVVGASGSGKNVLLEAIACTADGDTAGTIQLDKYSMTRCRFRTLCSFISSRRQYPGFMTLRSLLYYTASLTFGATLPANEIERRLHTLMRAFDLLGYGHEKLQNLSKSARRRAAVAIALVKDPLLLVVEDPFRELDPIASYQLMYCLRNYAAERSRIVLTTIGRPRSDICQIISRITVLFHGEVMYSEYRVYLKRRDRRRGLGSRCGAAVTYALSCQVALVTAKSLVDVIKMTMKRDTHKGRILHQYCLPWRGVYCRTQLATLNPNLFSSSPKNVSVRS
ncbi:hypothetical protein Y032_0441g1512 [Ancylostoma ceylanicum]|nr:hypothetical protein Y032_0441g1512 [Ancylostoma ceylanicum]